MNIEKNNIRFYKIENVIETLKGIDIDAEHMQYILKETGIEWSVLRQLILTMPLEQIEYLIEERKDTNGK
jgi:hypothetical protein